MECATPAWINNRDYLEGFHRMTTQRRVPLSGSIEITHRCNLSCLHCYLGPQSAKAAVKRNEMSADRLLSVIDEITDAGCLFLTITGGEPLLRKDFINIYSHSKSNGLLVTVFTNGTLIGDRVLDLFTDLPPQAVEITLYGASERTYEKITGIKGSYGKCLDGIRRLTERKVKVSLKTILMETNKHELPDMNKMAMDFGVRFHFDAAIFPRFNGDKDPLRLRVSPEEAVEKELSDADRLREWKKYCKRLHGTPVPETLYKCGAGLAGFHIDPYGNLMPCLMATAHKFDLSNRSFLGVWNDEIASLMDRKARIDLICNTCEDIIKCGYCPAFFNLENGSEDIRSEYLCSMGKQRSRKIR